MAAESGGRRWSAASNADNNNNNQNHLTPDLLALISTVTIDTSAFLAQNDLNLLPSQTLALESLISSTSRSLTLLNSTTTPYPPPIDCWFNRFLNETSSDDDARWTDSFRMSKRSFSILLKLLTPSLQPLFQSPPPNYILAAAIYRLAHGTDYESVGRRFGMDAEEACRAFFVVCKSVHKKLGNLFEFQSDMKRIRMGFLWMGLPNCCGVLGIERFEVSGKLFGENGAVMLQAVVDSEGRFVDVSAGWPSSMEVWTILRQTKLYAAVEERELLDGEYHVLSDGMSVSQYLLGDSCFPLLPWLLTPYVRNNEEDSFSSKETAFNAAHARGIELARTAFARVKARWRLLAKQWKEESVEYLPFVIVTGCILHNFLIKCNEYFPDDENAVHWVKEEAVCDVEEIESAHRIRDTLASHFSLVSTRI
ncbi:unnamed protein product [Rhodiola kirilowii]